jgi:phosphopantothenoylcysteine decarboxylase/phosphopantothenate--cysteine ligase
MASAAWLRGADVVLIAGPMALEPPHGPRVVRVETSIEMGEALDRELEGASVLVMAAAVSDFLVPSPSQKKIKRGDQDVLEVRFEAGPDLLVSTREQREKSGVFTLGFALETEDPIGNARKKLEGKGLDLVAVNEAGRPDRGVDAETNQVTLLDAQGVVEELPLMSKVDVAERLLEHLEKRVS